MDNNVFDDQKNHFLKIVNDTLDSALSENKITQYEMGRCAAFILDEMELMKTDEDLLDLLKRVNTKWKIFDSLITIFSQKELVKEDTVAIDKVKDMLASFNVQN